MLAEPRVFSAMFTVRTDVLRTFDFPRTPRTPQRCFASKFQMNTAGALTCFSCLVRGRSLSMAAAAAATPAAVMIDDDGASTPATASPTAEETAAGSYEIPRI